MNRLQTIDADTLQSTAYEPVSFVVDDLLPQGLHLLAGAPKIGKSWLALWLCLCAAQGKPLWTFATCPCEVLYLCLEDSFQRKLKHQSLPILEQMLETLRTIRDRRLLWSEDIVSLNKKISELSSQNQTLAFLKQNGLVDPDIFISKSNELTRQLRQAKLDKEKLMAAEGDATAQRTQELIALLEDGPDFLDHPDTELCGALVAEIIVGSNDTLRFRLHNGLELRESIERTVR